MPSMNNHGVCNVEYSVIADILACLCATLILKHCEAEGSNYFSDQMIGIQSKVNYW